MPRSLSLDIQTVRRALKGTLPGQTAHLRMAPFPREPFTLAKKGPLRRGAVLILLYPKGEQLFLPLTKRTSRLKHHQGQISLPGGAQEPGDSSLWETALREAREEIGFALSQVEPLAALSPLVIASSRFEVHPYAAYVPIHPHFRPNPSEVAELIEFPLERLLLPEGKEKELWLWQGQQVQVPFYTYQGWKIWGATAMILSELEVLLCQALERESPFQERK
ncbi:MAG: CoA pyrophosphatase [Anaerolineae bacterium]|nr:CoA pyrophosphatase [Anaerolineae bacterium]